MGLVQVATNTVTSAVASFSLIDTNPTDNVYMCTVLNMQITNDNVIPRLRFTKTSDNSANTTSNYDLARKDLKSYTTFGNGYVSNHDNYIMGVIGTPSPTENINGIYYIYNMYSSSEYTFLSEESSNWNSIQSLSGGAGGGVLTVAESHNGVNFSAVTGSVDFGTYTLYKVI